MADVVPQALLDKAANATLPKIGNQRSFLKRSILHQLIRANLIEVAGETDEINTTVFLVGEPSKERNRVIAWPHAVNELLEDMYQWCKTTSMQRIFYKYAIFSLNGKTSGRQLTI